MKDHTNNLYYKDISQISVTEKEEIIELILISFKKITI